MEMEKVKKILMWIQAVLAWIAGILGAKQAKRQWQQALSRFLQKPLFATKTIINIINPLSKSSKLLRILWILRLYIIGGAFSVLLAFIFSRVDNYTPSFSG